MAELKPCGTSAAYRRHLRHGETPCDACTAAEAERGRPEGVPPRKPAEHGTQSKYSAGCRCEPCTVAHREACNRWREAVAGLPAVFFEHGASGYRNYACRCAVCTKANADRCRRDAAQRRAREAARR